MLPNIKKSTSSLNNNILGTRPTTSINKISSDKNLINKTKPSTSSNSLIIKTNSTNVQELQEYLNILLTKYMELKSEKRQVLEIESKTAEFHVKSKKMKQNKKEINISTATNQLNSLISQLKSLQITKEELFLLNSKKDSILSTSKSSSNSNSSNTEKSYNFETNKDKLEGNNKENINQNTEKKTLILYVDKSLQTDIPLENEYFKNHSKVLENEISSLKFNIQEKDSLISKLNVSLTKKQIEISEEILFLKKEKSEI